MKRHHCVTIVWLVFILLAPSCNRPSPQEASETALAVLGAFEREVALLEGALVDAVSQEIEGIKFTSGRLHGKSVVVAWTGIGKVNAAMTTTLLVEHFKPEHVIVTGIAGGVDPNLEPGDIVIGRRTAHHDMGIVWPEGIEHGGVRNRLTGDDNPVFFPADPNLMAAATQAARETTFKPVPLQSGAETPQVIVGTIVTGDVFVASKDKCAQLEEMLEADAVEMEGAAVAQVCYQRGIPCLVVRSIADKADESAVVDKQKFYALAAENSARLVVRIVESLGP